MPRLEIHHADGNVTYAELSQDRPTMIGSGPNCDVVLTAPDVKRIHCRIVWRQDRWRIEVAADAAGVQLGEKVVKAGTVRSGETIGIGACRIYVDADQKPGRAREAVEPAPYSDAMSAGAELDQAEPVEDLASRRAPGAKPTHLGDQRSGLRKAWDSFRTKTRDQFKGETDRLPGEERILSSPLIRWMALALVAIIVLGGLAYWAFYDKQMRTAFDKAQEAMNAENWETAMQAFDGFLKDYPRSRFVANARVQRSFCEVGAATTPSAQLEMTRKMIRERSKEGRAYTEFVPRLGEKVGQIALNLAEMARDRADPQALELSLDAQDLLRSDLSLVSLSPETVTKIEQTMELARAEIKKATEHRSTVEQMTQANADKKPFESYRLYEQLVQVYKQFEDSEDVRARMSDAHKIDLEAVQWDGTAKNADVQPRETAVGATVLLMDRKGPSGDAAPAGAVTFSLAGGVCYAHDVATGKYAWHQVVGIDADTLPLVLPGTPEPTVLVGDLRHNELLAVRTGNGQPFWRQPVGEPFECAPLIYRGRIYQPTSKGSLVILDAATGRLVGRLQFAEQRFSTSPVVDANGQRLFLLGEQYVLYVIGLGNPPKCETVFYLGHRPDSIIAAPLRIQRYLVLCENDTASNCIVRVLLLKTDGTLDRELQRLGTREPINGWVHATPPMEGNQMFVATDQESVYVFSLGPAEKEEGFSPVTAAHPATAVNPRGQVHPLRYAERAMLAFGTRLRHYEFQERQATLAPRELPLEGAAALPLQMHPAAGGAESVFLTRRVPTSSAVNFTALDVAKLDARVKAAEKAKEQITSLTGETRWDVLLGDGLLSIVSGDQTTSELVAFTRSGRVYRVPAATLKAGGVVDQPANRIQLNVELSAEIPPVVLPDRSTVYTPGGEARQILVRGPAPDAQAVAIELPAPLVAPVVAFGDDGLLAPAADGRVYWLSWKTGKQLGEPYQPPLQADQPFQWRGVAVTGKGVILALDSRGMVHPLEMRKEPLVHLTARGEPAKLPRPARSGIAVVGNVACCVDDQNKLRTWNAETSDPIGEWSLPAAASLGPMAVGGHILVVAGHDEVACVNPDGQRAWQHPLDGETVAGVPLVRGDVAFLAMRSGVVRALRISDGNLLWTINAEKPLASGPVAVGEMIVVAGDDGSLNVLKLPAAGQN